MSSRKNGEFGPLVDAEWLAENLGQPDLRIVDATWYLPIEDRDARAEHAAGHVPGATYIDISELCDRAHPAPHMLPPPDAFAAAVGALGIGDGCRVIVYDRGEYAATRVWWMFRVFGHDAVAVLDGGLAAWTAAGGATDGGVPDPAPARFTPRYRPELVRTLDQVRANLDGGAEILVDARPPARFAGELPEMRPGVESGHIPGSVNLHYTALIDPASGRFLPPGDIAARFAGAGLDIDAPIVATCGSGVSACHLALGLHLAGRRDIPVYDGSWAEWGAQPDCPRRLGRD